MTDPRHASRRGLLVGGGAFVALGPFTSANKATAMPAAKRILFVVSDPATSPANGMEIGYWLPELAHPYWAFMQRSYELTIASPQGGQVAHDRVSDPDGGRFANPRDLISLGFKAAKPVQDELAATRPLAEVTADAHDAIFVVGGLGPPVTFTDDTRLHSLFAAFHDAGKLVVAICHGSLVLLKARGADGRLLAEGRRWTGYTNLEEDVVDQAMGLRFQPYRIEDEARKIPGTHFEQGPPYKPYAVTDGCLITGQQGSSGMLVAEHVIRALET